MVYALQNCKFESPQPLILKNFPLSHKVVIMKEIEFACKLAAMLITAILVINLDNSLSSIKLALVEDGINGNFVFLITIGTLFFVLNFAAAIGLYYTQKWGFLFAYVAILFSSIVFSTSYVPFSTLIFSNQTKTFGLIVSNVVVLYYVFYFNLLLHKKYWR